MRTDVDLERALRLTFAERADSVTDGPVWHSAGTAGDAGDELIDLTDMTPPSRRSGSGRWRAPLLVAAAVAVVAVVASGVITGGFGGAKTVDTAGVPDSSAGMSGDITADTPSGTAGQESSRTTVTVNAAGVITVSHGDPRLVLDIYEDALCPICADFENSNGAQIARAIDDGLVAVRYRMVDFLNPASASGTYSTRAYAAMLSVATHDGDRPDVFTRFYAALFAAANQPVEQGSSDLSNGDLAALAADAGASEAAQRAIADGTAVETAQSDARSNLASLTEVAAAAGRAPGTPTVAVDGAMVRWNSTGWLADLLSGQGDATTETQAGGAGE